MCRIIQASAPYFRNPYPYESLEGRVYLRLVLRETQKKNTAFGYLVTRLAPIYNGDEAQVEELTKILHYIDPSIVLTDSSINSDISSMAKWYKETFGVPGTPEFEENLKRINQQLQNGSST